MPVPDHRASLRGALEQDPHPTAAGGDRLAAVLALLIEEPTPSLLFTERALHLNRHAGEVSFPGGLWEPQDAGILDTALRETHEEIGLDPVLPDVLGALPAVHTFVSGILVTPFVGVVRDLPPLEESAAEIARVLVVATRTLASVERKRELRRAGTVWSGWSYDVGEAIVWGATGAMLHAFLELVRVEAPWLV
jgi:8-oxo-dGTP pyrophosphatase MutT (NUDIX family)